MLKPVLSGGRDARRLQPSVARCLLLDTGRACARSGRVRRRWPRRESFGVPDR